MDTDSITIIKVLLIGSLNTGKSCIIQQYVTKNFVDRYIPTFGIDFYINNIKYEGNIIKLRIWDVSGAVINSKIVDVYYGDADVVILVFDLTNNNSLIELDNIINRAKAIKNLKAYVVGNKYDIVNKYDDQSNVTEEQIISLSEANNLKYYKTSAKTGYNINNLFNDIILNNLEPKKIIDKKKNNNRCIIIFFYN
jgi:small GTP-binding protein